MARVVIQHFFEQETSTLTYVVHDESGRVAVVIDPVRDFDPKSGRTSWRSAEGVAQYIDERKLRRDAAHAVERLQAANAQNRAFAQKLEHVVGTFCLGLCRSPYHVNGWACDPIG